MHRRPSPSAVRAVSGLSGVVMASCWRAGYTIRRAGRWISGFACQVPVGVSLVPGLVRQSDRGGLGVPVVADGFRGALRASDSDTPTVRMGQLVSDNGW